MALPATMRRVQRLSRRLRPRRLRDARPTRRPASFGERAVPRRPCDRACAGARRRSRVLQGRRLRRRRARARPARPARRSARVDRDRRRRPPTGSTRRSKASPRVVVYAWKNSQQLADGIRRAPCAPRRAHRARTRCDPDVARRVAGDARPHQRWDLSVTGGAIYLTVGDKLFETADQWQRVPLGREAVVAHARDAERRVTDAVADRREDVAPRASGRRARRRR